MAATETVRPRLSVVLPAYNEEARLPATLAAWASYLSAQSYDWEIVVADDGSRDGTVGVAQEFAATHPSVRVLRLTPNRGKGGAVRQGVLAAEGQVILFADADLGVPAEFAAAALATIDGGADVATGERSLRTYASEERSIVRLAAGLAVQISRRALGLTFVREQSMRVQGIPPRHRRRGFPARDDRFVCLRHRGPVPRTPPGRQGTAVSRRGLIPSRLDF